MKKSFWAILNFTQEFVALFESIDLLYKGADEQVNKSKTLFYINLVDNVIEYLTITLSLKCGQILIWLLSGQEYWLSLTYVFIGLILYLEVGYSGLLGRSFWDYILMTIRVTVKSSILFIADNLIVGIYNYL